MEGVGSFFFLFSPGGGGYGICHGIDDGVELMMTYDAERDERRLVQTD